MADQTEHHIPFATFKANTSKYLRMVEEGHQVVVHRGENIVMVVGRNGYRPEPDEQLERELAEGLKSEDVVDKRIWLG